ncbi:hypothetical protein TRIP_C20210 [Candidatus Zixiibacteriota bacterium]|nr:hypothetical protein TRIP_C20210 [candidate division Zixibacteria bacterium]
MRLFSHPVEGVEITGIFWCNFEGYFNDAGSDRLVTIYGHNDRSLCTYPSFRPMHIKLISKLRGK